MQDIQSKDTKHHTSVLEMLLDKFMRVRLLSDFHSKSGMV